MVIAENKFKVKSQHFLTTLGLLELDEDYRGFQENDELIAFESCTIFYARL